jgi:hypothetical protein
MTDALESSRVEAFRIAVIGGANCRSPWDTKVLRMVT